MLGLLSRTGDVFYALRFLRLLTTPWKDMGAYKVGVIDENGNVIKSPETSEQKSKFTLFHRLVFNIKRLMNKIPLGKTTTASYLAALYLLKEETKMSEANITRVLLEASGYEMTPQDGASKWFCEDDGSLRPGTYHLVRDIPLAVTGATLALRNSSVEVSENASQVGTIFGTPVFEALHLKTRQRVLITTHDIIP